MSRRLECTEAFLQKNVMCKKSRNLLVSKLAFSLLLYQWPDELTGIKGEYGDGRGALTIVTRTVGG
eukprot:scaffold2257_cov131-Alexandrium_tamarense.AAC.1